MSKPIRIKGRVSKGVAEIKALMPHDMESGLRREVETGELVPAHYITNVEAEHNSEIVFTAYWGPAVSKNPFIAFSFTGAQPGDTISIRWLDSDGETSETQETLK